jgi:hypothetical protein
VVPLALAFGALNPISLIFMLAIAFGIGLLNTFVALLLDESYGYYNSPEDSSRLIVMALVENLGFRQMTVLWRIRALLGGAKVTGWGNMERKGVANLDATG